MQSKEQIDARLPTQSAEELLEQGHFDLPRQVMADYGDRFFISTILSTPFGAAYNLLGFQGLMLVQHDRPKLFHYLLERQLAQTQQVMEAWADVGINGVYAQEIFTGADLISPSSYDEFVFAYNQPYFQHMSALGLLPIHYVCGDVIPRLKRIAQLDIAAIGVEESKKGFVLELDEVVNRVEGRVAVLGNIDAVHFGLHATMKEMVAEVKRQARIGARAKGFVISTGSPFPLDTNPRLIDAMVNAAHGLTTSPSDTGSTH
jgi:uroporphyrinogen-III decarboxylase